MSKSYKIRLSLFLTLILMLAFSMTGFAAPDYISADDVGSGGWLTITNPDKTYSTTYNSSYSIAGVTDDGATVYVYKSNGNGGYTRLTDYSQTVGASGWFVIPVKLNMGRNAFLIRSELGGASKDGTFEINLLSSSMYNLVKNFKGGLLK